MSSEAYTQKAEQYLKLNDKYLMDAYALIAKGNFVQASEKLWGAAAEIVKAIAARRGIVIISHAQLYKFVSKQGTELEEPELIRLFRLAGTLHQNFYEDWLPPLLKFEDATDYDYNDAVVRVNLLPSPLMNIRVMNGTCCKPGQWYVVDNMGPVSIIIRRNSPLSG